jgi:hypothetical protein
MPAEVTEGGTKKHLFRSHQRILAKRPAKFIPIAGGIDSGQSEDPALALSPRVETA